MHFLSDNKNRERKPNIEVKLAEDPLRVTVVASSLGAKPSKSKVRPKLPSGHQPLLGEDAEQNGPRC